MHREEENNRIIKLLTALSTEIEKRCGLGFTDIALHSEHFFKDLLNTVYGYQLEKLPPNTAAIDLGDKARRLAVQVTATATPKKIRNTISKFVKYSADEYDRVVVLEVGKVVKHTHDFLEEDGYSLNVENDIWNVDTLLGDIAELPVEKLSIVRELLESECGNRHKVFLTADEFFRELLSSERIFHHSIDLIGRDTELASLQGFVDGMVRVAILPGRGGVGKSRLLLEFSRRLSAQGITTRFMSDVDKVTPESIATLPDDCCIIVDDAHRLSKLSQLLKPILARRPNINLILGTRPYGVQVIDRAVQDSGYDISDRVLLDELSHLKRRHVEELAAAALGPQLTRYAPRLAEISRDCPLITVVGGGLIAEKRIHPNALESDQDFRNAVMAGFHDALIKNTAEIPISATQLSDLLAVIAGISPINAADDDQQERIAGFLGLQSHKVKQVLGRLESYGFLLRSNSTIRIVPDVLSDYVLHKECVTEQNESTGFGKRLLDAFPDEFNNVLRNLAELDWRTRDNERVGSILDESWNQIAARIRDASSNERDYLLSQLKGAAVFLADEVVELLESLPIEQDAWPTELVVELSYTSRHLPRCLDILLRRCDSTFGPYQELLDIADYRLDKPALVQTEVMAALERWVDTPSCNFEVLLGLLKHILRKTKEDIFSEGNVLTHYPKHINYKAFRDQRTRAVLLLERCVIRDDPKVAKGALEIVRQVIMPPYASRMSITKEMSDSWLEERLAGIQLLQRVSGVTTYLTAKAAGMVAFYAVNAKGEIREHSRNLIKGQDKSFELGLIKLLIRDHNAAYRDELIAQPDDGSNERDDHTAAHDARMRELDRVATEFKERYPNPRDGVRQLNRVTDDLSRYEDSLKLDQLLFELARYETGRNYASKLASSVIEHGGSLLQANIHALIGPMGFFRRPIADYLMKRAVQTQKEQLCSSITQLLTHYKWTDEPNEAEVEVVSLLLADERLVVRKGAIESVRRICNANRELGVQLVSSISISDSKTGEAAASLFDSDYGIDPDALPTDILRRFLEQYEAVDAIDGYYFDRLLKNMADRDPEWVVDFLLRRIERGDDNSRMHPVPITGFESDLFEAEIPNKSEVCERIIDRVARLKRSSRSRASSILASFCGSLDNPVCLSFLRETIRSKNQQKIESAVDLLASGGHAFVFQHFDIVEELTAIASEMSSDLVKTVESHLISNIFGPYAQSFDLNDSEDSYPYIAEQASRILRNGACRSSRRLYEGIRDRASSFAKSFPDD